ncbi:MAG: hypothetical protein ACRC6M_12165 [Microcystaceae cyanobacterium]
MTYSLNSKGRRSQKTYNTLRLGLIKIYKPQIAKDGKNSGQRLQDEIKRWDDRFVQLIREQGQTARTIIIAAASVV